MKQRHQQRIPTPSGQTAQAWRSLVISLAPLAAGSIGLSPAILPARAAVPSVTLTVAADRPGAPIRPTMWGVFFEDINFGADGGLYAELVKNRSFEFPDALMGWSEVRRGEGGGAIEVREEDPVHPANRHYVRLKAERAGPELELGLRNEGFSGMGVRKGEQYRFSVQARAANSAAARLRVELVSSGGRVLGVARISRFSPRWQARSATLRPTATDTDARLVIRMEGTGTLDLDMISLFPTRTWKNRPNGLRADLVRMLADLRPGFLRFPGGCIVEGRRLDVRYQWKNTVGDPIERRLIINRWNDEFKHRPEPDYFQSFGLGFYEYFLLSEDIGAEPLPILNCGMACQFNSGELVPLDQLEPFIQDALDLIEFANGPTSTTWGARRAALGHARPFNLKLLGIGNEQWGPQYIERYERFARVLKARHPEIQLVSSAGPRPEDELFHFLWPKLRELKADIVDEHCYATPDWFLNNTGRYDGYDRHGPKVFMGEYAAQSVKVVSPDNRNDWGCALAEAAYMTGLERNADVVVMASYAPLFGHEQRWQWRPNLIWLDNLNVYGTPSYYVQQLFSRNRGDVLLPLEVTGSIPAVDSGQAPRFYASATRDHKTGDVILKIVNATPQPVETSVELTGVRRFGGKAKTIILASSNLSDENSLAEPRKVAPVEERLPRPGGPFRRVFQPQSLTVLRVPVVIR